MTNIFYKAKQMQEWMGVNKTPNPEKTNFVIFNTREIIDNLKITLNGTTISQITDIKYLELTMSDLK